MSESQGRFRYTTDGNWYKGNTHLHSTASDGGKTFAELARMYAGMGYNFLCRTDHWVSSTVKADAENSPVLWIDGIELDGRDGGGAYFHVACLGTFTGITREMGFDAALAAARTQDGLLILAHPQWTGNTFDDALRWNFHGVEVYNHVCHWLNGKGDGGAYWHAMLARQPQILGLACDDAHIRAEHPGWNGGWIVVNAPELTQRAIMAAIRAGNFYSSTGPDFHSIVCEGNTVAIETSPVQFARLVGPAYLGKRIGGFEGNLFTAAKFDIPPEWAYAYLQIEDAQGRRAWTNALRVDGRQ
ncbi:MAG TPA: hypothetical protein PKZ84_04560 [Anaerolineae bacterium]|nr:hypothetical protein [Anaerolineae bacterium]HQI83840.1 hypothetical protein [Anaerolineae bacterium]